MAFSVLRTVPDSQQFKWKTGPSQIITLLNWPIFLRFAQLNLATGLRIGLHRFPSLVSFDGGCDITDLPQLQFVNLGFSTFEYCHSVVFESGWTRDCHHSDLPQLQTIELEDQALWGDGRDARKEIFEPPYNYKNKMVMKSLIEGSGSVIDLPSLSRIRCVGNNLRAFGSAILESTNWGVVSIRCAESRFGWMYSRWNLLLLHSFHSVFKHAYYHLLICRRRITRDYHSQFISVCCKGEIYLCKYRRSSGSIPRQYK